MKRSSTWLGVFVVCATAATVAAAPAQDNPAIEKLKRGGAAAVSVNRATGTARFVRSANEDVVLNLVPARAGVSREQRARTFFRENAAAFGLRSDADLKVIASKKDPIGNEHISFQQVHGGVPVWSATLRSHFDRSGRLYAVNGVSVADAASVNLTPKRSAADAGVIAISHVLKGRPDASRLAVKSSELVIYRTGLVQGIAGTSRLAHYVTVGNGRDVREFVAVDAHTGKVLDQFTGTPDALDRRAFDGDFDTVEPGPNYPANPFWVEGDPLPTTSVEADNMIYASAETYDVFNNGFGRDSFDGLGATMDAIFNRGWGCPNASWNGTYISFCNGFTTDDVTAHEWGHAYTDYTHDLIYAWQPGALNESYSDIWGETVDRVNARGLDSPFTARTAGACSSFSPGRGILKVNSPSSIAGNKNAQLASFGPTITSTGTTGDVVLAVDGAAPANDACTALTNGAAIAGKIAILDRGTCTFVIKVKNAQNAGAIGVIVANNVASGLPGMGGTDATITIPSLGITQADGTAIKTALGTSTVNATLKSEPGTDNSYRWLMGEEVTGGGALRDMWDPTCYSNPGKVTDTAYYVCSTGDNGGVHTNSGIPNKAYALLVDGGTYNGRTVRAIGLNRAVAIYYQAQTVYQTQSSDFSDHADALEQSCQDLKGQQLFGLATGNAIAEKVTQVSCRAVRLAVHAVEMRTPPTQCGFTTLLGQSPPAACTSGTQTSVFNDDFETGLGAWTLTNAGVFAEYVPRDWVLDTTLPDGVTGQAAEAVDDPNLGDCSPGSDDQSGVVHMDSPTIVIPAGNAPRIEFDHYLSTEFGWDGGNLSVSVNGGGFTQVPATAFFYNAYNTTLITSGNGNTNPLAGQAGWSGTDGGSVKGTWGTSFVDLTGFAVGGDSVVLRFSFGTDGCGGNDGWYVDNVDVYQCVP